MPKKLMKNDTILLTFTVSYNKIELKMLNAEEDILG